MKKCGRVIKLQIWPTLSRSRLIFDQTLILFHNFASFSQKFPNLSKFGEEAFI